MGIHFHTHILNSPCVLQERRWCMSIHSTDIGFYEHIPGNSCAHATLHRCMSTRPTDIGFCVRMLSSLNGHQAQRSCMSMRPMDIGVHVHILGTLCVLWTQLRCTLTLPNDIHSHGHTLSRPSAHQMQRSGTSLHSMGIRCCVHILNIREILSERLRRMSSNPMDTHWSSHTSNIQAVQLLPHWCTSNLSTDIGYCVHMTSTPIFHESRQRCMLTRPMDILSGTHMPGSLCGH